MEKKCTCKESSCAEDCTRNHTHKGFFCEICVPPHQPEKQAYDALKKQALDDADIHETQMGVPETQLWERSIDFVLATYPPRLRDKIKEIVFNEAIKEEQYCLCKDKGVIELIEEAVGAENQRCRNLIAFFVGEIEPEMVVKIQDALQVINKEV